MSIKKRLPERKDPNMATLKESAPMVHTGMN